MDTRTAATQANVTVDTIRTWCRIGAVAAEKFDVPTREVRVQWGYGEPRSFDREDLAKAIFSGIRAEIAAL